MEHTNEQNLNTERYLLDEMPAEERAAFEEHFFNCRACGEDLTAAARMFAAGHEIAVAEENGKVRPLPRRGWRDWVPQTAVASILTAFLTFFATRPVPVPGSFASHAEIRADQVRAATEKPEQVTVPANLIIDMPDAEGWTAFYCSIRNAQGQTVVPWKQMSPQSFQVSVQLYRELPRGSYEVVIEGVRKDGNRVSITSKPFEVVGER